MSSQVGLSHTGQETADLHGIPHTLSQFNKPFSSKFVWLFCFQLPSNHRTLVYQQWVSNEEDIYLIEFHCKCVIPFLSQLPLVSQQARRHWRPACRKFAWRLLTVPLRSTLSSTESLPLQDSGKVCCDTWLEKRKKSK